MKKRTKATALFLALALTLILGLTACSGGTSSSAGTPDAASEPAASSAASQADSSTPAPSGDVVSLKWVTVGTGMPTNYDAWAKKVNAYLAEKIGVNIEMEVVPWGDWETRRPAIVNTGGDYDIMFSNLEYYNNDVYIGAFLDISEMVSSVSPELYGLLPEDYWDACRVDGKIYAVPTYKDSSMSEFMVWDEALIEKLDIDAASYATTTPTLGGLTPALEAIKEDTGSASLQIFKRGASFIHYTYDNLNTGLMPIGVYYNDAEAKVVAVFEQADQMEALNQLHEWYNAGIINADAATKPEDEMYRPFMFAQGWSGAAKTSWGPNYGVDMVAYQWGPTIVSNDTVRGSLNGISSSCANPEKALEFLQLINTDSYLRDMFYYGEEGVDWEYTADSKVHRILTDWTMAGYTQGSFFAVTQEDIMEFNQWDEVLELNQNAEPSVLLGFTFDTTSVSDQLVNCIAIYERHRGELTTGTIDPATGVPALMEELRAAGFDDIVAEAQTQVDAFMASK